MSNQATGWYARLSVSPALMALIGGQAICGTGGTLLYWNRAPANYLEVNFLAMGVGIVLAIPLLLLPLRLRWPALLAAAALLATALFGVDQDGIRRWVSVAASLTLQPAFLLLPLLAISYARAPDNPWHQVAMIITALAIALQPDRSMAATLLVVAALTAVLQKSRASLAILAASAAALAFTLWRPDPLSTVPFVEGVIAMLWASDWRERSMLLFAAVALLLPLRDYRKVAVNERRAIIAFILCWATLLIASVIAPYPTPMLGYGASAIIGYFVSIIALRKPTRSPESL